MTTNRTVGLLSIGVAILGFIGAGALTVSIDRLRSRLGLSRRAPVDAPTPPGITLPIATMGPFRGLAVDLLWYRSLRLQEEGRYFEVNQLGQWITSLQPRFPQVWSYQAWNMAYNISVATHTPEERWGWVNKGIALLRDKGIVYNPRAVRLYRELGWIYFHKFGRFMDEMHWYYRQQLARQWQELLGVPQHSSTTRQQLDGFATIVAAPDSLTQLVGHWPGVAVLLDQMAQLGYQPDQTLLRQIGRIHMSSGSGGDFDPDLVALVAQAQVAGTLEPLLAFLRKKVLQEDYHMDPAFMLGLMQRYGPMDWRHPVSHGCYWSEMGLKMARELYAGDNAPLMERMTEIDLLNTNRQTIQAMQELTRAGRVAFDPVSGDVDLLPDPRFIPAYTRAMNEAKERIDRGEFGGVRREAFDQGHENFLLETMAIEYLYGDVQKAAQMYKTARDLYGHEPHNATGGRYLKPIAQSVTDYLRGNLDMMSNANRFIRAMLTQGFEHGLNQNQMAVFDRFVELGRVAYERYQQDQTDAVTGSQGRLHLLPFDKLLVETYVSYMQSPGHPLLKRSRVWANTPVRLQQRVGDRLLVALRREAVGAGLDPQRAFPRPPGLDGPGPEPADTDQAPVWVETK